MPIRLTPQTPLGSILAMPRPDFPRTLGAFQRRFVDAAACWLYRAESRWPDGFRCPRGGAEAALERPARRRWRCRRCGRDTSVTAGTVLHRTRLPLTQWFWARYLVTTHTPGLSALQLQRHLGIGRYETAWAILHKLRRAMVRPDRELLHEKVEGDETSVGGSEVGLRGGRERLNQTLVVGAVEIRGPASGRVRLPVVPDASGPSLTGFVQVNVEPGSLVVTDGWPRDAPLAARGYRHRPRTQGNPQQAETVLPRVHRVFGNLTTWLRGTHHGVGHQHLQASLDEFTVRFNRRRTPMAAVQPLLGLGSQRPPTTYNQLYGVELTG